MSTPLARLLAREHAAVYLLGVLGARAADPALVAGLRAAYDEHSAIRDALTVRLRALGVRPRAPAVGYAVPSAWHGDAALRAAAVDLESRCTAAYVDVAGELTGADRRRVATYAASCAVREVLLGGTPRALPGLRP